MFPFYWLFSETAPRLMASLHPAREKKHPPLFSQPSWYPYCRKGLFPNIGSFQMTEKVQQTHTNDPLRGEGCTTTRAQTGTKLTVSHPPREDSVASPLSSSRAFTGWLHPASPGREVMATSRSKIIPFSHEAFHLKGEKTENKQAENCTNYAISNSNYHLQRK